jgi:P27 family predicted phage terminase small subunit
MGDITRTTDEEKRLKGQTRYIKNTPPTKPITRLWAATSILKDYPNGLKEAARRFYSDIGGQLVKAKVLTNLDRESFIRLAILHGRLCELENRLAKEGETITQGDKTTRNPASITYKELFPQYLRLSEKYGLSPYDRRRLDLPTDDNPQDKSRKFLGL